MLPIHYLIGLVHFFLLKVLYKVVQGLSLGCKIPLLEPDFTKFLNNSLGYALKISFHQNSKLKFFTTKSKPLDNFILKSL